MQKLWKEKKLAALWLKLKCNQNQDPRSGETIVGSGNTTFGQHDICSWEEKSTND